MPVTALGRDVATLVLPRHGVETCGHMVLPHAYHTRPGSRLPRRGLRAA
jgi:hypothetical protein